MYLYNKQVSGNYQETINLTTERLKKAENISQRLRSTSTMCQALGFA
jgi:hypothetical protein